MGVPELIQMAKGLPNPLDLPEEMYRVFKTPYHQLDQQSKTKRRYYSGLSTMTSDEKSMHYIPHVEVEPDWGSERLRMKKVLPYCRRRRRAKSLVWLHLDMWYVVDRAMLYEEDLWLDDEVDRYVDVEDLDPD